ncbi:MAG: cyclic nucleotide-binding domain-containing protein [Deltaproteobacteria bacterium]|nr:cyclic nucleotide-binding domain-containing protein [Deltaproteobacteria bacterium]
MAYHGMYQFIEKKFGFPAAQSPQLCTFLVLAALCMAISVFGYTAASAVFLAGAGPGRMPLVYMLMGAVSLPVYAGFSQLIDRYNRIGLLMFLLALAAAAMIVLSLLARTGGTPVYCLVYMFYYMLWVLLADIMVPSIISDYYTLTDLKQAAPLIAGAAAVGGLAGGLLALLCSRVMSGHAMLAAPCVLCVGAILQLRLIGRQARSLDNGQEQEQAGIADTLHSVPQIIKRFPLIMLLACSSCLFILLNCIAEFQVFTIYSARFPVEEDLAGFMGIIMALQSVLQFAIIYFLSGSMMIRLGLVKMNLIYPLTTLLSFVGLLVSFRPFAAVAAHVNYDALYQSIDKQTVSLNFNALPHRIVGRARVLSDGVFYFAGIALAGCFLYLAVPVLSHVQISLCAVGLCLVFIAVRCLMGNGYLSALKEMLRSGIVGFDELSEDVVQAAMRYGDEVPNLLADRRQATQLVGIELAARSRDPLCYSTSIEQLFTTGTQEIRAAVIDNITAFGNALNTTCRTMLEDPRATVRKDALTALIRIGEPIGENLIGPRLDDPDPAVRALASVYAFQADLFEDQIIKLLKQLPRPGSDDAIRLEIIRAARDLGDMLLLPLIVKTFANASTEIIVEGLKTVGALTGQADMLAEQVGLDYTGHPAPPVRAEAVRLLGEIGTHECLPPVVAALNDPALPVRNAAAEAIAVFGPHGVRLAAEVAASAHWEAADAALTAIARSRETDAENIIYRSMQPVYRLAANCLRWKAVPDAGCFQLTPASLFLEDLSIRIVNRTMRIFNAFNNRQAVQALRMIFSDSDARQKSGALETLDSLRQRRFIVQVLPLFRTLISDTTDHKRAQDHGRPGDEVRKVLKEMLSAPDRWIRIGALMCYKKSSEAVPPALLKDDDELVRTCAAFISGSCTLDTREDFIMNRLLFLKNIPLFQNLSFDKLLALDGALCKREYLQDETIVGTESVLSGLYIVYRGVMAETQPRSADSRDFGEGDYLGELALFDTAPVKALVTAKQDCVLLVLDRERFRALAEKCPDILYEFCRIFAGQARKSDQQKEAVL